ncbi:MAG: hypothetical protein SGJ18_07095 [Pseudomonadota bacterium]|nr:hypothetical protein [Pseudomonadota bacterium]
MKLLIKITFIFLMPTLVLARGAGGGGDSDEAIILRQDVRERLILPSVHHLNSSDKAYQVEFCEAAKSGLKKLQVDDEVMAKANEVCSSNNLMFVKHTLRSNDGFALTAMNWPESSKIAINGYRMEQLRRYFSPKSYQTILQMIGAHEILSLMGLETSENYGESSKLLTIEGLTGIRSQNALEQAIGQKALRFQTERKTSDLYIGLSFHQIREQLMSFSPAFDREIENTLDNNYKRDFRSRRADRGNTYLVPWNDHLLNPVITRLLEFIRSLSVTVQVEVKPSWALAIQLHQVLLGLLDLPKLEGYTVKISSGHLFSFASDIDIDHSQKLIEVTMMEGLNKEFSTLHEQFRFEIIRPEAEFLQRPKGVVEVIQNWPEINIGRIKSKYVVTIQSGHFIFNSDQPAYLDTAMLSSSTNTVSSRKSLGLVTRTKFVEAIK